MVIISLILFFISIIGIYIIIKRKILILMTLPNTSLDQETFLECTVRLSKQKLSEIHPQRLKMYAIKRIAIILSKIRILFSKMHNIIEIAAKKTRQASQDMYIKHSNTSKQDKQKKYNK